MRTALSHNHIPLTISGPFTPSGDVLVLLSDELLGYLDLLGSASNVEQLLAGVGMVSAMQLHVGTGLDLDLTYGVTSCRGECVSG